MAAIKKNQADQTGQLSFPVMISVDAMGSDDGPASIVAGCAISAKKNSRLGFILHGPTELLQQLVKRRKELVGRCEIRHASDIVSMEDKPSQAVRTGTDTSMWSAIESVRTGEASVAVSCGNTGALMAMSMIRLRKLPGVQTPCDSGTVAQPEPPRFQCIARCWRRHPRWTRMICYVML